MRIAFVCLIASCSSKSATEDASRRAVGSDADVVAIDAALLAIVPAVDAGAGSLLDCRSATHESRGSLRITTDPATLRGELVAFDTSKATTRHLLLRARPHADQTVFVFDGYGADDSKFKGRRVRRTDRLERGNDIVVRIEVAGGERRLVLDGAFQLSSDFDRGTARFGYRCD